MMREFKMTEYGEKYCTGNFFVTYWSDEQNKTIHNEVMTMQQLLNHLVVVGWPFNISAECKSGGKTFAKLLTRWDEELKQHWYVIAQLQGSYICKEIGA